MTGSASAHARNGKLNARSAVFLFIGLEDRHRFASRLVCDTLHALRSAELHTVILRTHRRFAPSRMCCCDKNLVKALTQALDGMNAALETLGINLLGRAKTKGSTLPPSCMVLAATSSSEAAATRLTRYSRSSSGFSEGTQHGVVGEPAEDRLFGYFYEDDVRLMRLLEEELD